jgi:hypothetical protein
MDRKLEPQAVDAELLEVAERCRQPGKVTPAVAVCVPERLDGDAIDHRVLEPKRLHAAPSTYPGRCRAHRWDADCRRQTELAGLETGDLLGAIRDAGGLNSGLFRLCRAKESASGERRGSHRCVWITGDTLDSGTGALSRVGFPKPSERQTGQGARRYRNHAKGVLPTPADSVVRDLRQLRER